MNSHPLPALSERIEAIMETAFRRGLAGTDRLDAVVRPSDHADFQSNAALGLAKLAGRAPRDIAQDAVDGIGASELIGAATVSGPGFVNLSVTDMAIWLQVAGRLRAQRFGIGTPEVGGVTVIDYSAPNVAKQMHVGHLRTTIIGDCLARLLEFLGSTVVRQNHLGDWETQFGMLIPYLVEHPDTNGHTGDIAALDARYQAARTTFDADPDFAARARERVVALQTGDPATLDTWRELVSVSTAAFNDVYRRLGVGLGDADLAGESSYNRLLDDVVAELVEDGIAVESDGALCVFFDDRRGADGAPAPLIVRKRDGGYGYAATDLATIRYRLRDLKATRLIYVVDARQSLHFQMVFDTARRAGWLNADVEVIHTAFGTILGPDGRPFKTRSGGTVPLTDLLDTAVEAATKVVRDKNPGISADRLGAIAEAAGIGAVKYADLSTARTTDYRFNPEQMVALTGNTGVYLQYAHTRIASVLAKASDPDITIDPAAPLSSAERALALHLDSYGTMLTETAARFEPHLLAHFLYTLAKKFSVFYESSPILAAETATQRRNRLALVVLTKRILAHGLGLLGIAAPDRM